MGSFDDVSISEGLSKQATFFSQAVAEMTSHLTASELYGYAERLTHVLEENLGDPHSISMLPSFIDELPTGQETGRAIAIDVGGSTMRFALVEVGHQEKSSSARTLKIVRQRKWHIEQRVKDMDGELFFDWIAGNVKTGLTEAGLLEAQPQEELRVGLVWSFPLS